jgi:thioredoxin-dependent peroxiredoxin
VRPRCRLRSFEAQSLDPKPDRERDRSNEVAASIALVIQPGDQAPDFALTDQDGREVELADLRGKPVVLYFYPKADTPGCTTQACGVRDHQSDYSAAGATVLGISPDPVAKVKKFHDKQALNFPLLADEGHGVAETFGVWVQKSMYGKTYMGNERTTFIIDPEGKVAEVLRQVKPGEHDRLVLEALARARGHVA